MANLNNLLRLKVDFENTPIMDLQRPIKNERDFDDMIDSLRHKFFGR